MLVLTRRINESFMVVDENGDTVAVKVIDIKGKQVRVGISAPINKSILREELMRDNTINDVVEGNKPKK